MSNWTLSRSLSLVNLLVNSIRNFKWHLVFFGLTVSLMAVMHFWAVNSNQITLGKATLKSFNEYATGVFQAYGDGFHEIAIPLTMDANKTYKVSYKLENSAKNIIVLTSDLIRKNYESVDQDENKVINQYSVGKNISYVKNSGNSPGPVLLRFFYTGNSGLQISNISVNNILPNYLLFIPLFIYILIYILLYYKKIIHSVKKIGSTEWNFIVTLIFLIITIARFLVYLRTPFLTGDEYDYKTISTWLYNNNTTSGLNQGIFSATVNINNLLFPYIGSTFLYFGENFYAVSKLYNSICISFSAYILYVVSLKNCNRLLALMIAILIMLMPFNAIGSFFLTEPTFLLALTIVFYCFLKVKDDSIYQPILIGFSTLLLSAIRPNGFMLLIAYFLYLTLSKNRKFKNRLFYFLSSILIYYFFIYIFKKIGIYSQQNDIYSEIASLINFGLISKFYSKEFYSLVFGHIFSISYIYLLPIYISIIGIIHFNKLENNTSTKIARLSLSLFIAGISVSIIFTVVASLSDLGGLGRWHLRYYYYTFPFLLVCFFSSNFAILKVSKKYLAIYLIAILIIIILGLNSKFIDNVWFSSSLDNIDNQWLTTISNAKYYLILLFSLFIIFTLRVSNVNNIKYIYFVYVIFIMILGNYGSRMIYHNIDQVTQSVNRTIGLPYSFYSTQCGLVVRDYLGYNPGSYIVIGSDKLKVMSVNFWLNTIPLETKIVSSGTNIKNLISNLGDLPRHIIINGDISSDGYAVQISLGECRILSKF